MFYNFFFTYIFCMFIWMDLIVHPKNIKVRNSLGGVNKPVWIQIIAIWFCSFCYWTFYTHFLVTSDHDKYNKLNKLQFSMCYLLHPHPINFNVSSFHSLALRTLFCFIFLFFLFLYQFFFWSMIQQATIQIQINEKICNKSILNNTPQKKTAWVYKL